jgi:Tfp pilus assembly protein PilN
MIILGNKTALGIDIAEGKISLALLGRDKDSVKLLKAASMSVPAGAVENGVIKDPASLIKAVRQLKSKNSVPLAAQTAISLFTEPAVIQLIDIPRQIPQGIGQHVLNHVKQCVALTGKKIALDFCRIDSGGGKKGRFFVAATDSQMPSDIAGVCSQASLNIKVIEPALSAYVRAFYPKKVKGRFDCNILLVILHNGKLNLCVFRNQILDFIRVKNIEEKTESSELVTWIAQQINEVIRFYDFEVSESPGKWEITVATDSMPLPEDAQKTLNTRVTAADVSVRTPEDVCQDISVKGLDGLKDVSVAAVGLAMKFLDTKKGLMAINLLPRETAELKSFKKDVLLAAIAVAIMMLVMTLVTGGLGWMTRKVKRKIVQKQQTEALKDVSTLFKERKSIDEQIEELSNRPAYLSKILDLHYDIDWSLLLKDISNSTPQTARITSLSSDGKGKLSLEGLAWSYEAVRLFVDVLNQSEYIDSASLIEAEKDDSEKSGFVRYAVDCSLRRRKEN